MTSSVHDDGASIFIRPLLGYRYPTKEAAVGNPVLWRRAEKARLIRGQMRKTRLISYSYSESDIHLKFEDFNLRLWACSVGVEWEVLPASELPPTSAARLVSLTYLTFPDNALETRVDDREASLNNLIGRSVVLSPSDACVFLQWGWDPKKGDLEQCFMSYEVVKDPGRYLIGCD